MNDPGKSNNWSSGGDNGARWNALPGRPSESANAPGPFDRVNHHRFRSQPPAKRRSRPSTGPDLLPELSSFPGAEPFGQGHLGTGRPAGHDAVAGPGPTEFGTASRWHGDQRSQRLSLFTDPSPG